MVVVVVVVVVVVQPTFLAYFPFLWKENKLMGASALCVNICVCVSACVSGWCWDMGEVCRHGNVFVGLCTCVWKVGYFMKTSVSQTLNGRMTGE